MCHLLTRGCDINKTFVGISHKQITCGCLGGFLRAEFGRMSLCGQLQCYEGNGKGEKSCDLFFMCGYSYFTRSKTVWVTFAQADVLERDALTKKSEIAIFPAQNLIQILRWQIHKKATEIFFPNFFVFSVLNGLKKPLMFLCFKINSNKTKIFHFEPF